METTATGSLPQEQHICRQTEKIPSTQIYHFQNLNFVAEQILLSGYGYWVNAMSLSFIQKIVFYIKLFVRLQTSA